MWQLTGSGWLASRHAQSDHGSTENGFCAKCHSPLQASASAAFNNGVVNAGPIPQQRFQAVTCATCHPPDNITAQIGALNPDAIDGGAIAIYLWKGVNNPASYQTLSTGVNADGTSTEDLLCLNCHEQRHNFAEGKGTPMYDMMVTTHNHLIPGGGPVRCIDCHMSTYQSIGGGTTGLPVLEERFHDWNVGADLPYSCGAIGSVSNCHNSSYSKFTVTDAQNLIPYIKEQHIDWWSLPPFNGVAQAAVPAHGALVEFKVLEREISKIDAM
ncbi:NapC/NirT family cytochrome c [Candidatus Binatus sp.]|uniref:NapC/NirT family cytochrome c n=1 Tax=Candidatus Binatus sp. TaxID=2811406 RepID=UPI002F93546D